MCYLTLVEFFAQLKKKIYLLLLSLKQIRDIFPPKACLFLPSVRYFSLYMETILKYPFLQISQRSAHLDKISLRVSHCSRLNDLKSFN